MSVGGPVARGRNLALTSVAANLAAILGAMVVFHDPIGSGALAITARFLAFCLVIAPHSCPPNTRDPDAAWVWVVQASSGRLGR